MQRLIDEPLPLRVLTIVLLVVGYFAVYRPAEQHLADLQNATRRANERASFGENLLARHDVYERAAERMRTELSGIRFDTDNATRMATFLEDLETETRAHNIAIAEIVPAQKTASVIVPASQLTVRVHGDYQQIVAMLNDIGNMHTLFRIDRLQMTRVAGDMHAGQTPAIDATISASLLPTHIDSSGTLQ